MIWAQAIPRFTIEKTAGIPGLRFLHMTRC